MQLKKCLMSSSEHSTFMYYWLCAMIAKSTQVTYYEPNWFASVPICRNLKSIKMVEMSWFRHMMLDMPFEDGDNLSKTK